MTKTPTQEQLAQDIILNVSRQLDSLDAMDIDAFSTPEQQMFFAGYLSLLTITHAERQGRTQHSLTKDEQMLSICEQIKPLTAWKMFQRGFGINAYARTPESQFHSAFELGMNSGYEDASEGIEKANRLLDYNSNQE